MFEIVSGELHAKLIVDSTMRVRRLGVKRDWQHGLAAAAVGVGGAWPLFNPTRQPHTATQRRRCGGRRRDRRARAGFEIDHSEPQARVWRSRGRPGPTAPGTPAVPHSDNMQRQQRAGGPPPTGAPSSPARRVRPNGTQNTSGATSTTGNQAINGSRAPSGSPTLRQHPSARAGAPNRRRPARGPRPRR